MNKQTYMIPEVGVQPLHLSACIMSGGEPSIDDPNNPDYGAPTRKVF